MIKINEMEPGVLRTFRFFTGIRLILVLSSLLYLTIPYGWVIPSNMVVLIVIVILDAGLLFVYLSTPRLIGYLQQNYLPAAIIWATLGPMLEVYLGFLLSKTDAIQLSAYFMTPLPFLMIFIPFVIAAWQYSHRQVLYFCFFTFLFDCVLAIQMFFVSLTSFLVLISIAVIRTLLFLLIGNMICNLMKVQREQRQCLTEANKNLLQFAATMEHITTSRERNRMARELHDILAHTMSGVAVELEGVRAILKVNPDQAGEMLDHSLFALREGLGDTRRALQALRSSPLEDLGLGLSVRNLVDALPNRCNYQIDLFIDTSIQGFSADVEQCFYRIAQEALNNIASHAQANRILLLQAQKDSSLKLLIEDNGSGFDIKTVNQEEKFGLLGMRERAEMIKGYLSITSQPGKGTKIELLYGEIHEF